MCKETPHKDLWKPPTSQSAALAHGCCGGRSQLVHAQPSAVIIPIRTRQGHCAGSYKDKHPSTSESSNDFSK